MTDLDYPAAHSMDTIWYAVDEAGHVAALMTGENDSVPHGAASGQLLTDLAHLVLGPVDAARFDYIDTAQSVDVYVYEYEGDSILLEGMIDRYRRVVKAHPGLHIDQLPPALRKEWKQLRFPGVRFAQAEYLQPHEFFNCSSYDVEAVAYLAADGTTVRPLPGREAAFAEALQEWREDQSGAAAKYRFEGVDDGR